MTTQKAAHVLLAILCLRTHLLILVDMPTAAPGWPNIYSTREVSIDTIMSGGHTVSDSYLQIGGGKASTNIGIVYVFCTISKNKYFCGFCIVESVDSISRDDPDDP